MFPQPPLGGTGKGGVMTPSSISSNGADGVGYNDNDTDLAALLNPPRPVTDVQEAIEALAGFFGAQGSQGPRGPQGPQGPVGAQGNIGPQGPQGPVGAQGNIGAQGPQGSIGPQGPQGNIGFQGSQGPQGSQGAQGSVGTQGDTGAQGPQGDTGAQGAQGSTGAQGAAMSNADGILVSKSTTLGNQSISPSTITTITFDTVVTGTHDANSRFGGNTTYTCPGDGYYQVAACIEWTASNNGFREVLIELNGSIIISGARIDADANGSNIVTRTTMCVPSVLLSASDTIVVRGQHDNGLALNAIADATDLDTWFSVNYLGPA